MKSAARNGFSILELLVVFAVLAILAALIFPALMSAREAARKGRCVSQMSQYGVAFRLYQNDHKGKYPHPWVNNYDNWQSFLCGTIPVAPWVGPNAYLPADWQVSDGGGKRIAGKFLCPNIVKTYGIPETGGHGQWGYCMNEVRTRISYAASGWPWNLAQYQDADLDTLYPKSGTSAVMTCGNNGSADADWDAFAATWDWTVQPVHGDVVNVLFLDGHVESMDVTVTEGRTKFNYYWYHGIPSTLGNPW